MSLDFLHLREGEQCCQCTTTTTCIIAQLEMESPFMHLVTTNYIPSKDEVDQINNLLVNP